MDITLALRQATKEDIPTLYALYDVLGKEDTGYFEACFEKECFILIASNVDEDADMIENIGFGVLNFEPKYRLYQALDIPEIQDLNVIESARERGVATSILSALENIARDQGCEKIGISVGLTKSYGAAQRLYVKMGYAPDGEGVTHDREYTAVDTSYKIDDDLALMMVKDL